MLREIVTSSAIILVCGILVREAMQLPAGRFEPLGPSFFPLAILYGIIGLTIVHLGLALWNRPTVAPIEAEQSAGDLWRPTFAKIMPLVTVVAFALFTLFISYTKIPFVILTFFFVVALSWTMSGFRIRSVPLITLVAAALVGVLHWLFVGALNLVLP